MRSGMSAGRGYSPVMAENLELARQAMAALSRQDLAGLVDMADPEVEWFSFFADLREGGVYRGHDGMRQYVDDLTEAFEVVQAEVDDGVAVGDVVLLVGRIHYRGRESGFEREDGVGWMLKFRQGKVLCFRAFRDPARVIEAVGRRD